MRFETVPTVVDGIVSLIYLKENATVGDTWDTSIQQSANGLNYTTRYQTEFVEKLTSHTVKGTSYPDVVHNQLSTYTTLGGSETLFSVDSYYWAKGVGLIDITGTTYDVKLTSYDVK